MQEGRRRNRTNCINISLFLYFGYRDSSLGVRVGLVVCDGKDVLLEWAGFDAVYAYIGFAAANKAKHWNILPNELIYYTFSNKSSITP